MKKNVTRLLIVLTALSGFFVSSAIAEMGLQQIIADKGAADVGQAVLTEVKALYAETTDSGVIQNKLIAILNEAAATGDPQIVRYTLIAVMVAGGEEHLALSRRAINNSNAFADYKELTAKTVNSVQKMIKKDDASGGSNVADTDGGGGKGGNQQGGSGGGAQSLGGGSNLQNPFAWGRNDFSGGEDGDLPATGI